MNIIAIDCGASFIKCALFQDEVLVKSKQVPAPPVKAGADPFCTDKIEALVRLVQSSLAEFAAEEDDVTVCVDNEMHGFLLAREDGTPYTDYISWQTELLPVDETEQFLAAALGKEEADEAIRRTGMPLRSGLPSSTLLWLSRNGCLEGQGTLCFYTLGDYILKRITGLEPVCHPTNAAATGLYDLETSDWNRQVISVLTGQAALVFPPVGTAAADFEKGGRRFHVLPAIGDQQAALLGSGFQGERELSFNMGTGAQVSRILKPDQLQYGPYQMRPYFNGTYLKTIPHVPSGRAINVYFRFLKDILRRADRDISDDAVWEIMQAAARPETADEEGLRCDMSFFENALTDYTTGSIEHIPEYGLTLEALMSGVFHRLIDNFVTVAERVNQGLPAYDTVIFSGGIAKRWDVLRNGIAAKLAPETKIVLSENDTLYGCMRYALTKGMEK
ncbi:MAG: hypothetical protein IJU96_00615 [Clostridia bacterium]|nr:hypothetical protein [Clostridia bacterium]